MKWSWEPVKEKPISKRKGKAGKKIIKTKEKPWSWTKGRGIKPSKYDVILKEFLLSGSECSILTVKEPRLSTSQLKAILNDRIFSHKLPIIIYTYPSYGGKNYLERTDIDEGKMPI